MNIDCTICSDRLAPSDDIYHTPCGHVFHFPCLTQWLERSKTCPQCRDKVTQSKIHRLYFNYCNNDTIVEDATTLQAIVDSLKFQITIKEREIKQMHTKAGTLKKETAGLRAEVRRLENDLTHKEAAILALKEQTRFFKEQCTEVQNTKAEVERLKKKLVDCRSVQMLINAPSEDVDSMISSTRDPATLITYITVMKRELATSVSRRKELRASVKSLQQEVTKVSMERNFLTDEHEKRKQLEEILAVVEAEKASLEHRVKELENQNRGGSRKQLSAVEQSSSNDGASSADRELDGELPSVSSNLNFEAASTSDDSSRNSKKQATKEDKATTDSRPKENSDRANDENSPYSGLKFNVNVAGRKRVQNKLISSAAYSYLAKKPRIARIDAADTPTIDVDTTIPYDLAYDGFGGHSRNDKFPSPKKYKPAKKASSSTNRKATIDLTTPKIKDFVTVD